MFRADAAFAKPEIYAALEERGVKYAIRLPANAGLERDIEELLTRPGGAAQSRTHRVVQALALCLSGGELEDRTTSCGEGGVPCRAVVPAVGSHRDHNLETPSRAVVRFYNEQWIKEGKQAVKMTRISIGSAQTRRG